MWKRFQRSARKPTTQPSPPPPPAAPQPEPPQDLFDLLNLHPKSDRTNFDENAVIDSIYHQPDGAKTMYYFHTYGVRCYPFTMAIVLGASRYALQLLLEAHPPAILETSRYGWTPLHDACEYRASSLDVIVFLVKIHPEALKMQTNRGQTPLHVVCSNVERTVEVVRTLAECYPPAMEITNEFGQTPLMRAEEKNGGVSNDVVTVLRTLHLLLLCPDGRDDENVIEFLKMSNGMDWNSRVAPVLRWRGSSVVPRMEIDLVLMPTLMERVGQEEGCVQTMFGIVRESMSLFQNVVGVI